MTTSKKDRRDPPSAPADTPTRPRRHRQKAPDPLPPGGKIGLRVAELLAQQDAKTREATQQRTGFSGSHLARLVDMPQPRVARLLSGHVRAPSPVRLARIAAALGVKLTDLFVTLTDEERARYCADVVRVALSPAGHGVPYFGEAGIMPIVEALREVSPEHADMLLKLSADAGGAS